MTTNFLRRSTRILVLNPNSSASMTHGVEEALHGIDISEGVEIYTYTAPSESPASINDGDDVINSCNVVYQNVTDSGVLKQYDAVLVACYSVHPLVEALAGLQGSRGKLVVTGIFEASVLASLSLLVTPSMGGVSPRKWGIVTTGKFWEAHLTEGVNKFLGTSSQSVNAKFAGVQSTGMTAGDFHGGIDPAVIRQKLADATNRLLDQGNVDCVVMGCAGMAGLEEIIRAAAIERYGSEQGAQVLIMDGVKAGIGLLEQMVRNKRMFQA
ncbi:Asp/Glu/hydantoin racemase [Lasiosphaeria miniovina]|uniref:Asp/Glu/hydantoin racemase n=1 Tax=Lasiosphaeria miniovina TaxID=1954250 RepID=A0AA40DZQ7_9PEZI|nr:Asp/Glu/hydantoin racemase [Lasiosphaeria miniovina]KAK0717408.1 Asp/Glu/hydantoin racemase [Lasiosphaeria miniovina]